MAIHKAPAHTTRVDRNFPNPHSSSISFRFNINRYYRMRQRERPTRTSKPKANPGNPTSSHTITASTCPGIGIIEAMMSTPLHLLTTSRRDLPRAANNPVPTCAWRSRQYPRPRP